jgi:DNA-binding response OmpR family regulator
MLEDQSLPEEGGYRIIVCDYTSLLQSVSGVLRMAGYRVFQAYDALAVEELCVELTDIKLLIIDTFGSGPETGELIRRVRSRTPDMPILHIGKQTPAGLPADVLTLAEDFTATSVLTAVKALIRPA